MVVKLDNGVFTNDAIVKWFWYYFIDYGCTRFVHPS